MCDLSCLNKSPELTLHAGAHALASSMFSLTSEPGAAAVLQGVWVPIWNSNDPLLLPDPCSQRQCGQTTPCEGLREVNM